MKLDDLDYVILKKIEERIEKYRLLWDKKEVLKKEYEVIERVKEEISKIKEEMNDIDNKIFTLGRTNIGEKK